MASKSAAILKNAMENAYRQENLSVKQAIRETEKTER